MRHTDTTPDESLFLVRTAWQRLRAQYLKLVEMQKGGHPVDLALLAQVFIDMNTALEGAMVVASRPAPLDEPGDPD